VGVELDLGATAKALASDRAARRIATATGASALVSLGGDVAVAGAHGRAWPVRVAEDHAAPLDAPGPVVAIGSGGLATSSTRVRSWPTDRGVAHHVIDPRTGRPAETPWRTVSVAAGSCLAANVLSTGALVVGSGAPAWLAERGAHARLVGLDGAVRLVGGWPVEERAAA
jgi:thiamine biosynthesis lipoprotein